MASTEIIKTHASRLTAFLGLQRSTAGVLAMVVLVGMGERMAERFLPIYMLTLGGGALAIGLLQAMDNLLSALYSFPGGYLAGMFSYPLPPSAGRSYGKSARRRTSLPRSSSELSARLDLRSSAAILRHLTV